MLCLARNPVKIGLLVPEIQAVKGFKKQKKTTKEMVSLVWLHICEFRLILLDHIKFLLEIDLDVKLNFVKNSFCLNLLCAFQ